MRERERERERERVFIKGDIVLLQTHSDNTAAIEQKFTTYQKYKAFSLFMLICQAKPSILNFVFILFSEDKKFCIVGISLIFVFLDSFSYFIPCHILHYFELHFLPFYMQYLCSPDG